MVSYACAENRRALHGCEGSDCRVLASIDIDIPDRRLGTIASDADDLKSCIEAVARTGVHGIVLAREYHEMRLPNLRAAGEAATKWFLSDRVA